MSEFFDLKLKTAAGLEDLLVQELQNLGAKEIEKSGKAVIVKNCNLRELYLYNLGLRTANRVLLPVDQFYAKDEAHFYKKINSIEWENYVQASGSIAVRSTVIQSAFRNSHFLSLKAKDAIVDRFRKLSGERPSVDLETPDLAIDIQVFRGKCTVSLDSSGQSLHKRGYRTEARKAPLNEVLAAGMILMTGWQGERTFIDPMCGAGTLLMEAAMIAANRAPGLMREYYTCKRWKNFDPDLWQSVIEELKSSERPVQCKIKGFDSSVTAMKLAQANLESAGLSDSIELEQLALDRQLPPMEGSGVLVINPPYGERLKKDNLDSFYKMIGDTLKHTYTGFDAWIISSNMEALKKIGLKPSKKIQLFNGPLECSYRHYELYGGSKSSSDKKSGS